MGISVEAAKSFLESKMHEIENEIRELSDWSNEQWLRRKKVPESVYKAVHLRMNELTTQLRNITNSYQGDGK